MDFIIEHWKVILPIVVFFILLMWGLVELAKVDWERRDKANAICKDFEDRVDEADTLEELLDIEKELLANHTTPNPFKNDSVLIQLNNPERVKRIMFLLNRKMRWINNIPKK